jgi:hypothetical protein
MRAGEARARVSLKVLGDRPSEHRRYLKIPESFQRDFHRPRFTRYLLPAAVGGMAVTVILAFVRNLSQVRLRWRTYAAWAVAGAAVWIGGVVNAWPELYLEYQTSQPLADFYSDRVLSLAMSGIAVTGLVFAAAMMADALLALAQGYRRFAGPRLADMAAVAALAWGFSRVSGYIESLLPGDRLSLPLWQPPPVEVLSPGLAVLQSALLGAFAVTAVAILAGSAAYTFFEPRRRLIYAVVFAGCAAAGQALTAPVFLLQAAMILGALAAVSLVVRSCGVAAHSVGLAIFLLLAARGVWGLWAQPSPPLQTQGVITAAASACIAAYWYLRFRSAKAAEAWLQRDEEHER